MTIQGCRAIGLFRAVAALVIGSSVSASAQGVVPKDSPVAPEMKYEYSTVWVPPLQLLGSRSQVGLHADPVFNIEIIPGPTLAGNAAALAAWERAAASWEAVIKDPVTVRIDADLVPDPNPLLLGGASSILFATPFYGVNPGEQGLVQLVKSDNVGSLYQATTDALPATDAALQFKTDPGDQFFTGPVPYGKNGLATKANFKALGYPAGFLDSVSPGGSTLDATIDFNSNQTFDFDRSNGITPGSIDFESVAAHEIGHALGFVSDVDTADAIHILLQDVYADATPTTLDLFRFEEGTANDPQTLSDFSSFPRSFQPGVPANTDAIIGGPAGTAEKAMSTGAFTPGADGRQASHWKDDFLTGNFVGLLDPTLSRGQTYVITDSDLLAMDLIGWQVQYQSVPEVTTVLPVCAALAGGIFWQIRRRRTNGPVA